MRGISFCGDAWFAAFKQHLVIHTSVTDHHQPYYVQWVRRFLSTYGEVPRAGRQEALIAYDRELARRFLTVMGPVRRADISADHVRHFLSYLAVERRVAVSTQNQAFNALLFLCRYVLDIDPNGSTIAVRGIGVKSPTLVRPRGGREGRHGLPLFDIKNPLLYS